MMFSVVIALIPCILWAMYNTGYQAQFAIASGGAPPRQLADLAARASAGFSFSNTNLGACA